MSRIIIKKGPSTIRENNGLAIPIFKIENKEYLEIESNDFPSMGTIFVSAGFNEFEKDVFYEFDSEKLKVNDNYDRDLAAYHKGELPKSPSKYILSYYHSNIRKTSLHQLIPIYDNRFSLTTNKLIENVGIDNNIFFLKEAGFFYGPFERAGNELKAASFKDFEDDFEDDDDFLNFTEIYSQYDGEIIFKISFDESNNFIVQDDKKTRFLVGFENFVKNNIGSKIDFTPLPILHKWAIDKLSNSAPKLSNNLIELKNIQSHIRNEIDKLKWDKYISLFEEITESQENIDNLVNVLNKKEFFDFSENSVNNSEIEKITNEVKYLKNELSNKEKVITTLRDRNVELKAEIEEEKSKNKGNNKIDEFLYPNLVDALSNQDQINEIEKILKEKITSVKLKTENERFSVRKDLLDEDIKKRENDIRELKKSVKEIEELYKRDAHQHTAKLQEAKIYTDLLNGIEILPNKSKNEDSEKTKANVIFLDQDTTAKTYINKIKDRLSNHGRELSFNEVANLVITINQTFITIIAGAPGVGKTSLVEKLSKSYGLNEDFGYLEIACAKGWTSSKDLIGFFNPLTNKFQPSKTKLKEALKKSEDNPNAPYLVLLDEANLSPIEHYWSDFIKLADTNYPRKIKISDNEQIEFGDGFRFIATINHDHTTEALSNRLIDRAAIIQLDKPPGNFELKELPDDIPTIFDYSQIQTLFKEIPEKWNAVEGLILIKDAFNKIKERLESNQTIIISPRKEIAINKYCNVANGLLEGNSYVALDFAISQHILPLINGRGDSFLKLLEGLKSDLNDKGMIKSEKLLTKIIERGKELKHFRYIYY